MRRFFLCLFTFFIIFILVGCKETITTLSEPTYNTSEIINHYSNYDDEVTFSDGSVVSLTHSVSVSGTYVTISEAGTYYFTGSAQNGQIIVNASKKDEIIIVLSDLSISNSDGNAINVVNADKVIINLTENTENYLTSTVTLALDKNAAIASNDDLIFSGVGSLTLVSQSGDGIDSDDDIIIENGTISVTSKKHGITANNSITVVQGTLTVNASKDALHVENNDDLLSSQINILGGTGYLNAYSNAMQSSGNIFITGGNFTLNSGVKNSTTTYSRAGIKTGGLLQISDGIMKITSMTDGINSDDSVIIMGGSLSLTSSDDGINAEKSVTINAGTIEISSTDDAIHSENSVSILGGNINILKSYEGIEGKNITISGGKIVLTSTDDGINAVDASSSSGVFFPGGMPSAGSASLSISGGYVYVNANGDGIDVNGSITMSGGTLLVSGPLTSGNGAIDYDSSFNITGGILIAAGSSGMAQNISTSSTQYGVLINLTSSTNQLFTLLDDNSNPIILFAPAKTYQSILISTPEIRKSNSYSIYLGGTVTNYSSSENGYYVGGNYQAGTMYQTFSVSQITTNIGTSFGGRR